MAKSPTIEPAKTEIENIPVLVIPTVEPLKIEALKLVVPKHEEHPREKYYLGLVPDAPLDMVTVGGIAFHKMIDPPYYNDKTQEQYKMRQRGQTVELTKQQIDIILVAITKKVVRFGGKQAFLKTTADARFRGYDGDEPLAKYLFIVRVKEDVPAKWMMDGGKEHPETLAS